MFGLSNALVESEVNEDAANMAAVDPAAFGRIAPLANANFVGRSAASAMSALRSRPEACFVESELADKLEVEKGDEVKVLFARGTKQQKLTTMKVLGLFEPAARVPRRGQPC